MEITELYKGVTILEGVATLKITKDHFEAYVEGQVEEFFNEIMQKIPGLLQEAGITVGICKHPEIVDGKLVVARGIPPIDGENGRIELVASCFQEENETRNGNIDFKRLNQIKNVSKNEVIAKRIPPTAGTPGKDIFGNEIKPRPGEWQPFKPGERVEIVDENTLVATDYGAIQIEEDGTISVKDEWTIDGDVDFSTGHIEFYGRKLIIKGSVLGGFTVEANGDVIIEKNIEDEVIVLAGGDLEVKGIIRSENTMIKTGGNLVCGIFEYARAFVGGDLIVKDYLLNGRCQVHGNVEVMGGKGLIAGGRIFMGGGLKAKDLGTMANVPTVVGAGIDPLLRLHYESMITEQESLALRLSKIKDGLIKISKVEKSRGRKSSKFAALKEQLNEALIAITKEMEKNRDRIKDMEEKLGLLENATICVYGTAYANTTLRIFEASLTLKRPVERVEFSFRNGEVVAKTLA